MILFRTHQTTQPTSVTLKAKERSDSCPCMDSSKTSSASGANCRRLAITESYGVVRSSLGTPSRATRDSNGDVTPAAPGLLAQRQLDSIRRGA